MKRLILDAISEYLFCGFPWPKRKIFFLTASIEIIKIGIIMNPPNEVSYHLIF